MGDKLVRKGLAIGIIVLFIGVAVQPGLSTTTVQDEKSNVNAKDYLFQTIIEITNNKEIKNIIQKSQNRESLIRFLQIPVLTLFLIKSRTRFGLLLPPTSVLTKSYLEYAYNMGVRLSKTYNVSKMHSILGRFKVRSQEMQKEITVVIEKNSELNKKIEQLSDLPCDCKKDNITGWKPPFICIFLFILGYYAAWNNYQYLVELVEYLGNKLNCFEP